MKKQTLIMATILCFLLVTWLPCQADDILYGCAKKENGQLRIVSDPSKCLKSEYSVSLHGTTGTVEQIGQLACVTANMGICEEDGVGVEVEIVYQKNITITDWNEVFDVLVGEPNPEGGYKFGLSCKNGWIMVGCTQSDKEPLDIDIKDSCCRDEEIPDDPASIYVTCCTQRTY